MTTRKLLVGGSPVVVSGGCLPVAEWAECGAQPPNPSQNLFSRAVVSRDSCGQCVYQTVSSISRLKFLCSEVATSPLHSH